jgi:tetratricopeptide (TPR) repeat protein
VDDDIRHSQEIAGVITRLYAESMPMRPHRLSLVAILCLLTAVIAAGVSVYNSSDRRLHREFERGWIALTEGKFAEVTLRISHLRQHPEFAEHICVLRAGVLVRTGDPNGGLEILRKIAADDQLQERRMLLICEALYQLKRFADAALVAMEILELPNHGSQAHRWLAAIYYDLGSMSQAEVHLQKLSALEPQDYSPFFLLGQVHNDFERYSEAIEDYRQALKRNPPVQIIPKLHLGMATAQAKSNDFHAALATLEAVRLEGNIEAQALLAECLWSVGRKADSQALLARIQVIDADHIEVLWLEARLALEAGQTEKAISLLLKVVAKDSFHDIALMELATLYRRLGNFAEADRYLARRNVARELFEQMVQLNTRAIREPLNAEVRDELAVVCENLGKPELAIAWRDAAKSLRPVPSRNK